MSNIPSFGPELIGKYINRRGWSDIDPVGRIIGLKGKSTMIVKTVVATQNKTKMEYIPGGFSVHCTNNSEQKWEFEERDETSEIRYSKSLFKNHGLSDVPRKYYDYNF